jgi:hypothetical protein
MDTDKTLRLSGLTHAEGSSAAGHRHPAGELCPALTRSTRKRENGRPRASELIREPRNGCPRQLRMQIRRQQTHLNRNHHSKAGQLRLFWD